MKYFQAQYTDLDGVQHTLPAQSAKQLNAAFDNIANNSDYQSGSWVETFVYEE